MRIALVHPFHWDDVRRGGERYFGDLAWYLSESGHDVEVITGTHGEPRVEVAGRLTVRRLKHRLPERLKARGVSLVDAFGPSVFRTLVRREFDVVHALTPMAAIASRSARKQTLLTAMGHPTLDQFGMRPGDLALARSGFYAAQHCAAFSDASARQVWEVFGRPCLTLPLGVRTADFPVKAPAAGPVRLLFAGFPGDPRKGVAEALRAMPAVLAKHPDARLLLPGRPEDRAHVTDVVPAEVLAATDDLGVLPMEQMPELYRSVTVSFLPSMHEALGIALVESLASGTPVVATRDGGMPSIVSRPEIGRLIETDLATALLDVIELAEDPATAARCAEHAQGWDWDSTLGSLHVRAYDAIVQSAGRR